MIIHKKLVVYTVLLAVMIVVSQLGVFDGTWLGVLATILMLVGGFLALIVGADTLVDGASSIAKHYKVSQMLIGMTILALGTSLPELFVNIIASIRGENDLLVSNIVGSNLSNILLITGVTAIIAAIHIKKSTLNKEIPISFGATLLLFIVIFGDGLLGTEFVISRFDSVLLLVAFGLFVWQLFYAAKNEEIELETDPPSLKHKRAIQYCILGMAGLYVGGEALVTHATSLASSLGVSTILIGASIIAFGTSVPELVTSIIAALKKHTDMAVGNIIGSNIFNILWIVGITGLINPIIVDPSIRTDILLLMLVTIGLFLLVTIKNKKQVTKVEGIVLVFLYAVYLVFLLVRG